MKIDVELVREALRRFNRRAGVLKSDPYGIGLSLSQGSALVDIGRYEKVKPGDLVHLLHLDKSSVSRMLDILSEKKLIEVSEDSKDRRSKNLKLTASGKKAVKVINDISDQSVADVLKLLDTNEQKAVAIAFAKLSEALRLADQQSLNQSPKLPKTV